MTTNWKMLASDLSRELGIQYEPIAITFSDERPVGVERYASTMPAPEADGRTGAVPAGCVFWIKGESSTFATIPEDHANCSVGSVTHGLLTLEEVMDKQDVHELLESGWVTAEEAMSLPVVQQRHAYVSYGPLSDTSHEPDVVLLRISPFHAMVLKDAFDEFVVVGKPQCHIIAMAKEQGTLAMSTGCMLSRIRTGMEPSEMTCAIPAHRMNEVVNGIRERRAANAAVAAYANQDRQRFA